jgi:peptide/nickel transport system substrate-binding protein
MMQTIGPILRPAGMVRRRRLFAAAGAGALGIGLFGCGRKPQQGSAVSATQVAGKPVQGGMLTVPATANANTLDPHATSVNITTSQVSYVLSRLLRFKTGPDPSVAANWEMENDLAQSIESPDGVTWTVKLRPNARFHNVAPVNGHTVEAEDVKATFVRALSSTANPNRGNLDMIDPNQIETPSSDTAVFRLKYKLSMFPWILASATYSFILPREALAGTYDPGKQVIGSGPFLFDGYQPDVAFSYKRNPDWFEKGRPYVDGVRAVVITDAAQQLAQFTSGHLGVFMPHENDIATAKQNNAKALVVSYMANSGDGYPPFFPYKDPASPFQDIRMRQAVSLAVDRDTIKRVLFNNHTEPAYVLPVGFGKWALRQSDITPQIAQSYQYDPARAKQLLAAAGYNGAPIKLGYITNFAPFSGVLPPLAETINNMLNAIGLKSSLVECDYINCDIAAGKGARFGNRPGDEVYLSGFSTFSGPDEALYNYYDSHSTANHDGLRDSKLDDLIDKARTTLDENDQVVAYKDAQRYMAEQVYAAWGMPQAYNYQMVQSQVQNFCVGLASAEGAETYSKVWLSA